MTTTDPSAIAASLYGAPKQAAPPGALCPSTLTAATTPATPPGAGPVRAPTPNDDEVRAAVLFDGGNPAESPEAYSGGALASGFDTQEAQARFEGNSEDVAFFREARDQAAGLMYEMALPMPVAKELTVALSAYVASPLSDDALDALNRATESQLRAEWGSGYEANVAQARRVYKTALAKMPSLAAIVEAGAGSDPKFIRALFNSGKRRR